MMERITKRDGLLVHTINLGDFESQNVLHRLAEYEDSGLEPYHISGILSDNHKIIEECKRLKSENSKLKRLLDDKEYTTLEKCWYKYYTGKQGDRKHLELKLVCTECHYVWDRQGYAFNYCPNCGRQIVQEG